MRINPCHGCPFKKGCELYVKFQARTKGIGARSVTFRCQRIVEKLPKGTKVTMSMPYLNEDGWTPEIIISPMAATILHVSDDGKFNAVMDKDERIDDDRFRWRKTKHVRAIVSILDEPIVHVCKNGNPMLTEDTCDNSRQRGGCLCAIEKANQQEFMGLLK
jgi:hypothetical protein